MVGLSRMMAGLAVGAAVAFAAATGNAMGNKEEEPMAAKPSSYDLAVKEIKKENWRMAIRYLNTTVRAEPRNADALNYLGFSHRKLGEFSTAVEFYTRALAVNPDHRGANEYLGEAYLSMNNLPKAEERLAHLWNVCGQSCEEYRTLNESVMAYKAGRKPNQSSQAGRW